MKECKVVVNYHIEDGYPIYCDEEATEHRDQLLTINTSFSANEFTKEDRDLWYCPECVKLFDGEQARMKELIEANPQTPIVYNPS